MTTRLRSAIDSATTLLADAGIDSARYDAEELAAHVAGWGWRADDLTVEASYYRHRRHLRSNDRPLPASVGFGA